MGWNVPSLSCIQGEKQKEFLSAIPRSGPACLRFFKKGGGLICKSNQYPPFAFLYDAPQRVESEKEEDGGRAPEELWRGGRVVGVSITQTAGCDKNSTCMGCYMCIFRSHHITYRFRSIILVPYPNQCF